VNPDWNQIEQIAEMRGIDAVQLHGAETPEFCRQLRRRGVEFEKALPVIDAESIADSPDFGTDMVLLDSGGSGEFGGSGRPFPWELAARFIRANPSLHVALAGGLTPENVAAAVEAARPFGVDVSSGVESTPGRKDHGLLAAFINAARAA
jgi:phosphoribosylanthranilate isomerase